MTITEANKYHTFRAKDSRVVFHHKNRHQIIAYMFFRKSFILFITAILSGLQISAYAQICRSDEFHDKYTLTEVVVFSRHNIRSPLSTNGSALSELTTHQWTDWSSAPSELTLKGGLLETMMGQFFRKWTVTEGLFTENYEPRAGEVNFYANSMQRTVATAQYFSSGFMPTANLKVNHRDIISTMDPIFNPVLTKSGEEFKAVAYRQIDSLIGGLGLAWVNKKLQDNYSLLEKVLNHKDSPDYHKNGKFSKIETCVTLNKGEEPGATGALKKAYSAADALILQYYEEPDSVEAAFGEKLTREEWAKIAWIKDMYGDVLFTAPIVAVNVAHPLLVYIRDELKSKSRKFTFLCGHDSNIASLLAALGVEPYVLPNSIEVKTPIGSKVVFEKWKDMEGNNYVSVNLVYQSTDQLRENKPLTLTNPPQVFSLGFKGLETNSDGLYSFEDVDTRFGLAINSYDSIR